LPAPIRSNGREMTDKIFFKEYTPAELEDWVQQAGQPRYRAQQLLNWVYRRQVEDVQAMTNLSKEFRSWLRGRLLMRSMECVDCLQDSDGTRKLIFRLSDGRQVESVLIAEEARLTLCLSTQVGCGFGCRFCLTGRLGLQRNLSAGEIVEQFCAARRQLASEERITNLVFMGMGEPLANLQQVLKSLEILTSSKAVDFSPRRITVSTVGLVPQMERLGDRFPVNLAVSLHAADNETRTMLMPVNRKYPLEEVLECCRRLPLKPRQRITFEYLLLRGVNDSDEAASKLARLLTGMKAKVNLIPFNDYPGAEFSRPSASRIEAFRQILVAHHLTATVRQSRGTSILAACGQLGTGGQSRGHEFLSEKSHLAGRSPL